VILACIGAWPKIQSISGSKMVLETTGTSETQYLTKVAYTENGQSGNGGGYSSTDFYFTNFTSNVTKNSITVKFYTSERPSSATIYYGTSSASKAVSTDITAKQISTTMKGLTPGTKYYFKCSAKSSSGSATSEVYPVMTYY
jgi:hypothetical protein